jgi:hypothetical protein
MMPAMTFGRNSEIRTVTTVSICVFGSTSGSRSANMSMITSARAPSRELVVISEAVYSGLVLTSTQPALRTPKATTG